MKVRSKIKRKSKIRSNKITNDKVVENNIIINNAFIKKALDGVTRVNYRHLSNKLSGYPLKKIPELEHVHLQTAKKLNENIKQIIGDKKNIIVEVSDKVKTGHLIFAVVLSHYITEFIVHNDTFDKIFEILEAVLNIECTSTLFGPIREVKKVNIVSKVSAEYVKKYKISSKNIKGQLYDFRTLKNIVDYKILIDNEKSIIVDKDIIFSDMYNRVKD